MKLPYSHTSYLGLELAYARCNFPTLEEVDLHLHVRALVTGLRLGEILR